MRLKLMAISDTHLGEDTSLLSFPHGRQHLWKTLRDHFGEKPDKKGDERKRFDVDEVILMGDITDRTLSSTSQIITHTNAFMQTLGNAADIKKGVFIPGNHEHTLWTDYHRRRYGYRDDFRVTGPGGETIVKKGRRLDLKNSAEELLAIFFGYPAGSAWRTIWREKKYEFILANPIYAKKIKGRTYVFTHGTHFRKDVSANKTIKTIADKVLQLDRLFGGIEVDTSCDVRKAKNLEELEKEASAFVDTLWPSSKNSPTSQSDELWYLLTNLRGELQSDDKNRKRPDDSKLFSWAQLNKSRSERIKRLIDADGKPTDKSIERMEKYFLAHLLEYLARKKVLKDKADDIVFVYGDTHAGGYGEKQSPFGGKVRIYNSGGWVVHSPKDHPACHIFIVDENGEEYLLDVSYKGVDVGGDDLIKLAAKDNENHGKRAGRIVGFVKSLKFWD